MHSLGARRLVRPPACLARKITEVKEEEGGARKGGEEGRGEGEEEKERVKGIGEEGRREGEEKEEGREKGRKRGGEKWNGGWGIFYFELVQNMPGYAYIKCVVDQYVFTSFFYTSEE